MDNKTRQKIGRHMQAFTDALKAEELPNLSDLPEGSSPASPTSTLAPPGQRVRKISALSDFAPVNLKVKK